MEKLVYSRALGARSARNEGSSPSPGTMGNIEAKSFAAELGAEMPELDLHDKFSVFNEDDVRGFVLENYNLDNEMVRIIYGIGQGILRKKVLDLLMSPELRDVIARVDEKIGSCVIIFKEDI